MTTWLPLLLADPSPCLRRLVLAELMGRGDDDPEVRELAALSDDDPLVAELVALQEDDGSWDPTRLPGNAPGGRVQCTAQALTRLGYLGLGPDYPAVTRGAAYLLVRQREDGAWPLARERDEGEDEGREGYSMMPLQTALPLRGLAACGYAGDPRAERAYDWLLARRLPDGAWPTGIAGGGAEPSRGFITYYARFDLGLMLSLCARVGAGMDDPRVADLVAFVRGLRGPHGLWAYARRPQVARWVTFDLLRSLSRLDEAGGWVGLEPRTPFQPYPSRGRRY